MRDLLRLLQCRPLVSDNINACRPVLRKVKMILDLHLDPDLHQNLITSRGSTLAHAYHVWSTSVNAFVSDSAHRMTDRWTNSNSHITPPWQSNKT